MTTVTETATVHQSTGAALPMDPLRATYRAAVQEVATNAKAALPDSGGRIDSAVQIVLVGDVALQPDGSAHIRNQSHGAASYIVVNGTCGCRDFPKAPQGQCKHKIARGIATRAYALASAMLEVPPHRTPDGQPTPSRPTPSTPGFDNDMEPWDDQPEPAVVEQTAPELTHDMHLLAPYITLIHGKKFVQYAGLLQLAHVRGLQALDARLVSVTETLAVAEAVATFRDERRFSEAADATPGNVAAQVRPHFARLALTRAKARALRDALGIDLCSVEELD
jgi:hypothetical protein